MDQDTGSTTIFSKQQKRFTTVLLKAVELLEQMRDAGNKDYRPKKTQTLRNVVTPLCRVIFFTDIANVLRRIYRESGGTIRMKVLTQNTPSVNVSVRELLDKIWKNAQSKAQKQRRVLLMAYPDSVQFKEIHRKMMAWKSLQESNALPYQAMLVEILAACVLPVSMDADDLIDMLKKSGIVQIDNAGKVKYIFPEASFLESVLIKLKSKSSLAWKGCTTLGKFGGEIETDDELSLDELMVHAVLHLQRMGNNKPKTDKALRNALKPILSLLYVASPLSILLSLITKSKKSPVRETRKRKRMAAESDTQSDLQKIVFKGLNESVGLHSIISKIGSTLSKKQATQKTSQSKCKKKNCSCIMCKGKQNLVNAVSGSDEEKYAECEYRVFLKLLADVQNKARHLNRSVAFSSTEQENECKVRFNQLLLAKREQNPGPHSLTEVEKETPGISNMDVDDTVPAEDRHTFHGSEDLMSTSENLHVSKMKPEVISMSVKEILSIFQSLSMQDGQIDPDLLIQLLKEAGYCSVEDNTVSYLDSFPKDYQQMLKAQFAEVLKDFSESFNLKNGKKAKTQKKVWGQKSNHAKTYCGILRKRPRYQ